MRVGCEGWGGIREGCEGWMRVRCLERVDGPKTTYVSIPCTVTSVTTKLPNSLKISVLGRRACQRCEYACEHTYVCTYVCVVCVHTLYIRI